MANLPKAINKHNMPLPLLATNGYIGACGYRGDLTPHFPNQSCINIRSCRPTPVNKR